MASSIGRGRRTMIALVVVTAVATATLHPTVAAPQTGGSDDYGGAPQLTINGQVCQCMVEFLCDASKIISIPPGSNGCGANNQNLACCRLEADPLASGVQIATQAPQRPQKTTTQEPHTTSTRATVVDQNQSRQCRCVPTKQCSANNYENLPDIDIRVGSCSSNQICCNNEDIITEPENPQDDTDYVDDHSCGVGMPPPSNLYESGDLGTRIVNTEDNAKTYFGQFPWMVVILKTTTNTKTGERLENVFQCGGSLIHSRVVLTAAHCVSGFNSNVLKVRVGEWDTQSSENEETNSHQDYGISQIIVHPNHHNGTMFNDVALIQLNAAVVPQKHIKTICIPKDKKTSYDSRSCVSTGWGKNGFGGKNDRYQNVLKQVHLSIVPHSTCQKQLRQTRLGDFFILDDSFICAGGQKGEDVCKGDGGGPLVCAMNGGKSNQKKYIQVGIVSWGIGCGDESIPGVYSSLEANARWINEHLKIFA